MSLHPSVPLRALLALVALLLATELASAQTYWPGRHLDWERKSPQEAGFDAATIQRAIDIAIAGESTSPRDLAFNHEMTFGREPRGEAVGPFTVRAPQTGLIVHKGYIIAEWGDPHKVDNTFSVSKSFLSTTVGLAYDRGLIVDVHDLVRPYVAPIVLESGDGEPGDEAGRRPKLLFESEHNRKITWDDMLRQTSDWEGTLWGKPEWADRPDSDRSTWGTRARFEPGTVYEYEIKVGVTSNVFKKGHRIRLEVSSSNFPRFDRNLNTGGDLYSETEMRVARQTAYHSAEYPSQLILPVIPHG